MVTISRDALGAQRAELRARCLTTRSCSGSPRRATKYAQGWELPADGAQRAASRRSSTSSSVTVQSESNHSGLKRLASNGCTGMHQSNCCAQRSIPYGWGMANELGRSTSPYLRQHAENPVDWREWSDRAFAEARERDVPVFLSVGYSACHWCHVMAHESFEDAETAAYLSEHF